MFQLSELLVELAEVLLAVCSEWVSKYALLFRDEAKGHVWASKGASVAAADMTDGDGLGPAIAGSDAVFVMLPPLPRVIGIPTCSLSRMAE
jgi:hypothetical protein